MSYTSRGIEDLEAICSSLSAANFNDSLFAIGKLIGQNYIDPDDGRAKFLSALLATKDDKLKSEIVAAGMLNLHRRIEETIERGIAAAEAENTIRSHVLIPGHHPTGAIPTDQSSDAFAEAVIRALPAGALYRSGTDIGRILGDPGRRYFSPCSLDDLRLVIDSHVHLGKWVTTKSGVAAFRYVPCTRDLAGLIFAAAKTHYLLREIKLLTSYPVYTGAGLTKPGWSDGFFYDEPGELSPLDISERPADPMEILHDLTSDFPFANEPDRHNFIGLLLTPIVRPSLGGNVPLHLIMASRPRTGKSKLAEEVLGGVILGTKTPAIQLTGDDTEIEKRITAKLRHGGTIWHLDNLKEHIDSPALASLLTASAWEGRVLGSSTLVGLQNNLTIVGTGNNVRATLELVERTVPIFLQPKTEDPSQRTDFFHPDLPGFVAENRKKILSTLLWMVEDWLRPVDHLDSLGRPGGGGKPSTKRLGGFERWAAVVGGILEYHGFTEWLSNQRAWVRRGDPTGTDLRALISAWARMHGGTKLSTRAIFDIADANGLFEEIQGKTPSARLLSFSRRVLRRHEDCPICTDDPAIGEVILRASSSGSNSLWHLSLASQQAWPTQSDLGF